MRWAFARPLAFPSACAVAGLAALLLAAGAREASAVERISNVAVFPAENLTGGLAPTEEVRQFFIGTLVKNGLAVIRTEVLEEFMARHRVRYAAGIDASTAERLRAELGVDAVLFPSIELAMPSVPPKVAVIARLVSITSAPTVVWADDAGMAGDDAPGFFELGVVNDFPVLMARALERLSASLLRYLSAGEPPAGVKTASKFRPKTSYRGLEIERGRSYTIAVVPFVNLSVRRNAGETLALLFMTHLLAAGPFRVVETGEIRRQFLDARIMMEGGISVTDAANVAALVEADYVLGGRVMRYEDYEGGGGNARVDFSAVLIERKSGKVVWSSHSYNDGTEGVTVFERGTSRTAHVMATQMVRLTAEMIGGRHR
jgi:TolB-like protein